MKLAVFIFNWKRFVRFRDVRLVAIDCPVQLQYSMGKLFANLWNTIKPGPVIPENTCKNYKIEKDVDIVHVKRILSVCQLCKHIGPLVSQKNGV